MIHPASSLVLDGKLICWDCDLTEGTLSLTQQVKEYPEFDAVEWRSEIKNIGSTDSGLIEQWHNGDVELAFRPDPNRFNGLHLTNEQVRIFETMGSVPGHLYTEDDAASAMEFRSVPHFIAMGKEKNYVNDADGRCSTEIMPFFDLNFGKDGYIVAVGWTGCWEAHFARNEDGVRAVSGIPGTSFRLRAGESVAAATTLVLAYHNGRAEGHNAFRRLMRKNSIVGKPGRPEHAMLAFESWGGIPSATMVERMNRIGELGIRFEHHWIDAGWCGDSKLDCPDCYNGDWFLHTGDWFINPYLHPNGFEDVRDACEKAGMRMMIWVEPERAIASTVWVREHPEWFLEWPDADTGDIHRSVLLNLGDEDARQSCVEILSDLIERTHMGCYRQDFNCSPAPVWRLHDAPDRKGLTEIAYINGLYAMWDALLERFPDLYIDNCSSGGRRIDIRTLRRSVPFFRSDFQCGFNSNGDVTQAHQTGASWYLPYTGCTTKVPGDLYTARSSYSAGWGTGMWCTMSQNPSAEELKLLKKCVEEMRIVREYFPCDYYQLCRPEDSWNAWQYNRPEQGDGMVMVFRHEDSPMAEANFVLSGLAPDGMYIVKEMDAVEVQMLSGEELMENFCVRLETQRSSAIYLYRRMK